MTSTVSVQKDATNGALATVDGKVVAQIMKQPNGSVIVVDNSGRVYEANNPAHARSIVNSIIAKGE